MVSLLESAWKRGELDALPLPVVVLASNGIYYQRLRQIYLEKLEESSLLGRLPDLWPDHWKDQPNPCTISSIR